MEVLVVDDASDQPVDDVITRAAGSDDRVDLVRLSSNRGAAGARNEGLERARGEFVAFMDDDDWWEPTKIARQQDYLRENPEVGAVSCDYFIDHDDPATTRLTFRGPSSFTTDQLRWVNFLHGFSLVMARRSLIGEKLRIDEAFGSAEDWDLWLRCAEYAPVRRICEPLAHYVSHDDLRLTDPEELRLGWEHFLGKHADAMSPACRAFHVAHQRMEHGRGWAKRLRTLGAVAVPSTATPVLALEQVTRQLGRLRHDPGLTERYLARALPSA
jgi:glycosyltransferase involved in cell wall biosynthesis